MSSTDDQLVADYLRRLAVAAESLPTDRRDELIEAITTHIAEARALSPGASGAATASVADTLARIVRAAAEQAEPGQLGARSASGPTAGGAVADWPTTASSPAADA